MYFIGAYAEYIAVSLSMCIHKPKELTWEVCAGIPEVNTPADLSFKPENDHDPSQTWMTAIKALFTIAEFTKGKSVLWHAGGSSVSMCGIQLALDAGASQVFVTAGTQDKINFCTDVLGATAGYNYKAQDWVQEIKSATNNRGVDIIVDFIGQNYFQSNLDVAAKDGRIVNLALLSGVKLSAGVDISPFLRKRVRYEGSSLRSRDIEYQCKLKAKLEKEVLPLIVAGKFTVSIEKVLKWDNVVEAHQLMESNQTKGKIICTVE
jgi:NADPH2:quinone reductase